jgi:hypothetical protein
MSDVKNVHGTTDDLRSLTYVSGPEAVGSGLGLQRLADFYLIEAIINGGGPPTLASVRS